MLENVDLMLIKIHFLVQFPKIKRKYIDQVDQLYFHNIKEIQNESFS